MTGKNSCLLDWYTVFKKRFDSLSPLCNTTHMKVNNTTPQFTRNRHGSLFDRGSADSYYGRKQNPHWYPKGTGMGEPVVDLTPEEVAEYIAGYEHNEARGSKKYQD
jgi:hypothetical protein